MKIIQKELSYAKLNYTGKKNHYKSYKHNHALTRDHDNETIEMFYEELEKAKEKKAYRHHNVMGDFNVKTGVRDVNENMNCIRPFGTGNRNERGGKNSWILLKKTTW